MVLMVVGSFAVDLRAGYLTTNSNGSVTATGSDATLSASANFAVVNSGGSDPQLVITLTNTSTTAITATTQVLTGAFFSVKTGTTTLTAGSGSTAVTQSSYVDSTNGTTMKANVNVSDDWAYATGLSGAPYGMTYGLSAVALSPTCTNGCAPPGLFSNVKTLGGGRVDTGSNVSYGLTPTVGGAAAAKTLGDPLIQNSVVFTIDLPKNTVFTTSMITNVAFQYGTCLTDTDFEVLPEPSTYSWLISLSLLTLGGIQSRRRAQQRAKSL